jgi:hypothetical protein
LFAGQGRIACIKHNELCAFAHIRRGVIYRNNIGGRNMPTYNADEFGGYNGRA